MAEHAVVDRNLVQARYGGELDFGVCYVGRNLNLHVLRGYAPLDRLAVVSAPDVFDQQDNPNGTQRELNKDHARECRIYAMEADSLPPEQDPRFFPEILLNIRDTQVLELYNVEDPSELFDFDSFSPPEEIPGPLVGVRIDLDAIEFPKEWKSPQISRVDGNHRLWGIDESFGALNEDASGEVPPVVGFSLLINLTPKQEAMLFRDINGEHKGMDVTHLAQIAVRVTDPEELKADPKLRGLWIADQLGQDGRAFEGMVFRGGTKEGLKRAGEQRPVKLNSLRSMVDQQIRAAEKVNAHLGNDPDALLELLDNYWKAVREVFPEAWADRRSFILLQTIGLGGFAKYGGSLLDTAFDEDDVELADFKRFLSPLKDRVSLKREDWLGIAGAGGAQRVAEELLKASEPDAVKAQKIRDRLLKKPSVDQKLGLGNGQQSATAEPSFGDGDAV